MSNKISRVLLVGGIVYLVSTYWYVCQIKYLCKKDSVSGLLGSGAISLFERKSENSVMTEDEINIPVRFFQNSALINIDKKIETELDKLIKNSLEDGSTIVITGQKETVSGVEMKDEKLADLRVGNLVDKLVKMGLGRDKIVVSRAGTLISLDEPSLQFAKRRVVLIVAADSNK